MPPHRGEFTPVFGIPSLVSFNFRTPELHIALWQNIISAPFMAMPKTSVHENHCPVFTQHQVGMSRQTRMIQSITETTGEQELADYKFRFGIPAFDGRHTAMPLFLCQFIHYIQFLLMQK